MVGRGSCRSVGLRTGGSGESRIVGPATPLYRCKVATRLPFHLVGVSHHTAGVSLRERLSLTPDETTCWLDRERAAGRTLVVLSTCNRFEAYWWGTGAQDAGLRAMAGARGIALEPPAVYRSDGVRAVRHLFRVAAGLDSQVLGEVEILEQVRRAHERARTAGTTNWPLDVAFTAAVAAGRRARRETLLGRHPASVSSAAVEQAKLCSEGSLADRTVLVLGAGKAAAGVLRALGSEVVGSVVLLNRNAERTETLTIDRTRVSVAEWSELPRVLAGADVVFAATAAPLPVIPAAALEAAMARRDGRPLVVLDLAVPRNVEPAARDVPGVRLFDLDDLRLQHCPASMVAPPELEDAERIVRAELARFRRALRCRTVAPHLAELHRLGALLAREEAGRALDELDSLGEREREVVRRMADRLARRLLYPASRIIRKQL
jgi:glutamyl-tRNA reductase